MRHILSLAALAAGALARTEVMVPLYVYPGNSTWTNPDWQAAVDAIQANPDMHFYIVINPNNGPLNTSDPSGANGGYCNVANDTNSIPHGCNRDWTTHLGVVNELPNAQTLGYVWTGYGSRPLADAQADIAEWAAWGSAAPTWVAGETADIRIHGLWFDEVGVGSANHSLYSDLISYANATFARARASAPPPPPPPPLSPPGYDVDAYTVVLNAGPVPDPAYEAQLFGLASAVVTKETCYTDSPAAAGVAWDCPEPYAPFEVDALTRGDGLPHDPAFLPQTVVIVHEFVGPPAATTATLREQIKGLVKLGLHSTYITSGSWHNTTIGPATIGNVGRILSVANEAVARACGWGWVAWLPWVCAFVSAL